MGPGPPATPPCACSPDGHRDPHDSLQEGEEAEANGQEGDRGARSPPRGRWLLVVMGLELPPLEEEAPIAADPPAVVPGAEVQWGV